MTCRDFKNTFFLQIYNLVYVVDVDVVTEVHKTSDMLCKGLFVNFELVMVFLIPVYVRNLRPATFVTLYLFQSSSFGE